MFACGRPSADALNFVPMAAQLVHACLYAQRADSEGNDDDGHTSAQEAKPDVRATLDLVGYEDEDD